MSVIYEKKLIGSTIYVYEDKIEIKQSLLGKINKGLTKGNKTIYFKNINAIELKLGSALVNGYMQFTVAGGNESHGATWNSVKDENSVNFGKKDNDLIVEIKNFIEQRMNNAGTVVQELSKADELMKYKGLLDAGAITQEEFDEVKKKLL